MSLLHAKLSASGSSRWLNCPGSVNAESEYKDGSSIFAKEGTAAHELADRCLSDNLSPDSFLGEVIEGVSVDADMIEYIQGYISFVQSFSGEHFYEQRLDFSPWVPEGFGTSDAIVIQSDKVHVIDLKYGKGLQVDAENNTQGMLYALGVYNDFGYLFDEVETFVIHIYQPRINNFSEWEISLKDLLKWGEWVKLQADLALSKDAERVAGDKQCQWCKAKGSCKTLADYTQKIIMAEFDNIEELEQPNKLTQDQTRLILDNKSLIKSWLDAVESHVVDTLMSGNVFDGFKMVEGRSLRRWVNDDSAKELLTELKSEDEIYTKKLLSPAQAEKLLGKDKKLLADIIEKPSGKPTLAKESDKRPALKNIVDMFDKELDS